MSGHQEYKCPQCAYEYESPERFVCPVCNLPDSLSTDPPDHVSAPTALATTKRTPDVLAELLYIAASPLHEHGGFHEQTIATAQNAVEEIKRLRTENTTLRRMIELNSNIEATFVDGTPEAMVAEICKLTHERDDLLARKQKP